jgi:pilus assembly protein Flp/PilA
MEMTRLWGFLARMREDERGATMIEYSILIGIITAVTIAFIIGMGDFVKSAWSTLCTAVSATSIGCTPAG